MQKEGRGQNGVSGLLHETVGCRFRSVTPGAVVEWVAGRPRRRKLRSGRTAELRLKLTVVRIRIDAAHSSDLSVPHVVI